MVSKWYSMLDQNLILLFCDDKSIISTSCPIQLAEMHTPNCYRTSFLQMTVGTSCCASQFIYEILDQLLVKHFLFFGIVPHTDISKKQQPGWFSCEHFKHLLALRTFKYHVKAFCGTVPRFLLFLNNGYYCGWLESQSLRNETETLIYVTVFGSQPFH